MTPASERKAKERQAKRDAGLVRVEVWVKPCHRAFVQQYAERLKDDGHSPENIARVMQLRADKLEGGQ